MSAVVPECGVCEYDETGHIWCDKCVERFPYELRKAADDIFDYMALLRTGELIRFESAEVGYSDWVRLTGIRSVEFAEGKRPSFARGLSVRVGDIMWIADAPDGS
jgi:hypothetical protein